MMKTVIIACLCTFLLVDACKSGGGEQGQGQQGQGQQGQGQPGQGQPGQSIEALNRAKRQLSIPGLSTLTDFTHKALDTVGLGSVGIIDPGVWINKFQDFVTQIPGLSEFIAKIKEFFSSLQGGKRRRRQITKWNFDPLPIHNLH